MLSSVQWELRRPKDEKLFEFLIRDLFAAHWNDPNTQINGRSGQEQQGVDIYGKPNQGNLFFGIQCKLRDEGGLTKSYLMKEIEKARAFRHQLDTYIFATTLPIDAKLLAMVEGLNDSEVNQGGFKVQIRFWENICSLLDEHPRLINKYFNKSGHPQLHIYRPQEQHPDTITPSSPLLTGIIIDVSNSMHTLMSEMPKRHNISSKRLNETINKLVEKAVAYCMTPEADEVLPRFALFTYGYGFGKGRQKVASILWRIGIQSPNLIPDLIPSDPVRDLFAEIASKESLPFTPDALDLHKYWDYYKKSIEHQFFDVGVGNPILYDSLCVARDRFRKELERPYYKYPLLIIVSSGQLYEADDTDIDRVVAEINDLGVQILCAYVGVKNIMNAKELFSGEQEIWPIEACRLFRCSSTVSEASNFVQVARDEGWTVPKGAKLFIQANQYDMLEELTTLLLNPLQAN